MEELYRDVLSFGCLRVFRHFSTYLRGREELLITIRNHDVNVNLCRENVSAVVNRSPRSMTLPPASPSSSETKQVSSNETLFLLGAYSRYGWPYVWLRSPCRGCSSDFNKDKPVELRSIKNWKKMGTKVWDFIEELVLMTASPKVVNPFEVDFTALNKLQPLERAAMSGATAAFFQQLLIKRQPKYTDCIKQDLRKLLQCHFENMAMVLPAKSQLRYHPVQ